MFFIKKAWVIFLMALLVLAGCESDDDNNSSDTTTTDTTEITLSADVTAIPADGRSTVEIEALLAKGSTVISDVVIVFSVDNGSIAPTNVVTDENGLAVATLTSSLIAGGATVTATVLTNSSIESSLDIDFTAVQAAQIALNVAADDTNLQANGEDSAVITALVKDTDNNVLANQTVFFNTDLGEIDPPAATTNSSGIATAIFTVGDTAGTANISATLANNPALVDTIAITISAIEVSISFTDTTVVEGDTISFTAVAAGEQGDPQEGVMLTFTATGGTFLGNQVTATTSSITVLTDTTGQATATLSTADAVNGDEIMVTVGATLEDKVLLEEQSALIYVTNTNSDDKVDFRLQLIHAADMEAGVEAVEDAPRFAQIINAFQDTHENTLILSSGDNFIPGPFFVAGADSSLTAIIGDADLGRADIAMLNAMGFQASAFGNHDFDAGTSQLAEIIRKEEIDDDEDGSVDRTYYGANFPYLSANLDTSTDGNLAGFIVTDGQAPQANSIANSIVITTASGEKIGVVGTTTPTLETISSPGDVMVYPENDSISDMVADYIQPAVDALVAQGIDKIILLSHMQQYSIEVNEIAPLLKSVDIIIAGGSDAIFADANDYLREGHTASETYPVSQTDADNNPILIVNTDGQYQYIGRLIVDFDAEGHIIVEGLNEDLNGAYAADDQGLVNLTNLGYNPQANTTVDEIAQAVGAVIEEKDGNVLGLTNVYLNGERNYVRTEETNLGNLTADANLFYAKWVDANTMVSIKNGGGIRASIGVIGVPPGSTDPNDYTPLPPEDGEISQLDIENSLRFNNDLTLLTLTAQELVDVIEHAVSESDASATPGKFPQISGMRFSFDYTKDAGSRVQSLVLVDQATNAILETIVEDGVIVSSLQEIRIVTLGYLADGGDGYPFENLANPDRLDLVDADLEAGEADFTDAGTEQDALAEYLLMHYSTVAFDIEDQELEYDLRIQNIAAGVTDTVFEVLALHDDSLPFYALAPNAMISLELLGSYQSGIFDESAAEITAYYPEYNELYVINGDENTIDLINVADPTNPTLIFQLDVNTDIENEDPTAALDGINSVAIAKDRGMLVAAIAADPITDPGYLAIYNIESGGYQGFVRTGALPDMVTFTPDESLILVANEGEPDNGIDPEGSISIIDAETWDTEIIDFNNITIETGDPNNYVRKDPNANTIQQDLEPEYITTDGEYAFVTLQENNAIAIIDIINREIVDVVSLGVKNHMFYPMDVSDKDDAINIMPWPVYGMYMPDSIGHFHAAEQLFLVTANEGDDRGEDERVEDITLDPSNFPNAADLQDEEALGRLSISTYDGDEDGDGDYDTLYNYGSRSFSIWDQYGTLVFDSGSHFEYITAALLPDYFNSSNDENEFDARSDAKGVEPEGITIGDIEINGNIHTYAFVGLERISGIMVYDVSNPYMPKFVQYINNRDFTADPENDVIAARDLGPEGLLFIPADESPNGMDLLVVSNEVSGSTSVYQINVH